MTRRDENRSLYLSYHEHCNGHDSDRMASFYASPIKVNGHLMDPATVAAQFPPLFSAFPDWHWEILNLVADDDYIVGRFRGTGTHRAAFQGIEATGRQVTISEFTLYRVESGKYAEVWDLAIDGESGFPDAVLRAIEGGGAPSA